MFKKRIITAKNNYKFSIADIIFTSLFTIAFLIQIIMIFVRYNDLGLTFLVYIGYIIWGLSIYFGLISLRTFKKRGGVEKGKSYINTTKLVKKGPYAIIRHPQYLGGLLFTISISLWTQAWLSMVLSIVIIFLTYHWTYSEEKNLIEKFGEDYIEYKRMVPRLNLLLGIIKYFSNKRKRAIV